MIHTCLFDLLRQQKLVISNPIISIFVFFTFVSSEKDTSISVEDLLYDIFKQNDADHLVVGDFLTVGVQNYIFDRLYV